MNQHRTMKELPNLERPYEKFLKHGATALSDAELLAVIIKSGTRELKSVDVAQNLLSQRDGNLLNLYQMSLEEMMSLKGIGQVKAIQLKCIGELSKRLAAAKYVHELCMNKASTIADYYMERLRHERREYVILSMFDNQCHFIDDMVISIGSVSQSIASPREVFLKALEKKAVYIILLHNHPSGCASPSKEDDLVTKRMEECGQLMAIPLLDHIIIGDGTYYSYRENGKIT